MISIFAGFLGIAFAGPIDKHATNETKQLFASLLSIMRNSHEILFGQQHSTLTGAAGGHAPYTTRSHDGHIQAWTFTDSMAKHHYPDELCDIKSLTGEYPAVMGFDAGHSYSVSKTYLLQRAADRGSVITVSWHGNNPVSNGSTWVKYDHNGINIVNTIKRILPGGDSNVVFTHRLDQIADWLKALKDSIGHHIPIIFRPFHEMNGNWFWWGTNTKVQNTADDYKQLFQFVVKYLRDTKGVHNLLYAYSPGKVLTMGFHNSSEYLQFYPGDDYVDLFGIDFYFAKPFNPSIHEFQRSVQIVSDVAHERRKLAAITETGLVNNGINSHHNFWTDHVLNPVKSGHHTSRIAYIFAWGNKCPNVCEIWVPYKGHPAENSFMTSFYHDPITVFGSRATHAHPQIVG